jgi:hypothetical protein
MTVNYRGIFTTLAPQNVRLHLSALRQLHTGRTLVMDHKIDGSNPAIRSGIGEMANEKKMFASEKYF